MKRIGSVLMAAGLGIGVVAAVASIVNVTVDGVPLLQAIGLGRLSFVVAGACLVVGAALRRVAFRKEQRTSILVGAA